MKRKCINCEQFDDGYRNCGENGSEYDHCGACLLGVRNSDYYNNEDISDCFCTISKKEFDLREELNSVIETNYFTGFHISGLESDLKYYKEQNQQLRKDNEELKTQQNKLAVEKLEEVLKFIYGNKWTNIELCVDNSPLKIIRNKLDTMISGLKGDK